MKVTEETRRVGREIKMYLARNRLSRKQFSEITKLGKSTVDKLISGRYSAMTLEIVKERSKFVSSNSYAAEQLGGYSKEAWKTYLRDYLFLRPSPVEAGNLEAWCVFIEWEESPVPGLVLKQRIAKSPPIGALGIPQRSPLIYIQPVNEFGRHLIVCGIMLVAYNLIAHTYVPFAMPIVLRRLNDGEQIPAAELGTISPTHSKFKEYAAELQKNIDKQFCRWLGPAMIASSRMRKQKSISV